MKHVAAPQRHLQANKNAVSTELVSAGQRLADFRTLECWPRLQKIIMIKIFTFQVLWSPTVLQYTHHSEYFNMFNSTSCQQVVVQPKEMSPHKYNSGNYFPRYFILFLFWQTFCFWSIPFRCRKYRSNNNNNDNMVHKLLDFFSFFF